MMSCSCRGLRVRRQLSQLRATIGHEAMPSALVRSILKSCRKGAGAQPMVCSAVTEYPVVMESDHFARYHAVMDDRHLKTTAFEPVDDGYVYYERAWAKGIRVTVDERELYLSGAHIDWLQAIVGRHKSEPRRPYWRGVKRMALAMLLGFDPDERRASAGN